VPVAHSCEINNAWIPLCKKKNSSILCLQLRKHLGQRVQQQTFVAGLFPPPTPSSPSLVQMSKTQWGVCVCVCVWGLLCGRLASPGGQTGRRLYNLPHCGAADTSSPPRHRREMWLSDLPPTGSQDINRVFYSQVSVKLLLPLPGSGKHPHTHTCF